ncbi:hypothetical protein KKA47_00080, partial [bacterium]|nr:hypothetical protein [bacterium]
MQKRTLFFICTILLFFLGFAQAGTDDKKKAKLIKEELDSYTPRIISFSIKDLKSEEEKNFAKYIIRVGKLIEELNMLQTHPMNLDWYTNVSNSGTEDEKELYYRNQGPWCLTIEDELCKAFSEAPAKRIGYYHWPEKFEASDLEKIRAMPDSKSLLSPFTVVRKEKDKYIAIPFAKDPLFEGRMKKMAIELRSAAAYADTSDLKQYLLALADAFESDSPFPYDISDYDWIGLHSKWELNIGPYETYKNPFNVKARFKLLFGILDDGTTDELDIYKNYLQTMENKLGNLAGDLYKPRRINEKTDIRAVNAVLAAGDARSHRGATVAFNLPNRGPSVEEGLSKKVILINHSEMFNDLMKARAVLVLEPTLLSYVDGRSAAMNIVFHEFSHGFGPYNEYPIQIGDKKTTVGDALGKMSHVIEEAKADTLSWWYIPFMVENEVISEEEAVRRYVTGLMSIFGHLQYNLSG